MEQKLTFTAYLKDEYSKKFDKLAEHSDKAIMDIAKDLDKLASTGKKAARTIDDIDRRIKVLSQAKKVTLDTSAIKFANQEIKNLQRERDKLDGTGSGSGMFGGMGGGFAIAGAGFAVAAGLKQVASSAIDATVKYQKYEAVLTNTMGSQSKAKDVMQMIVDVASTTPFQVDELTSSFVKLQSQGFNPTKDSIVKLGDLAASMGKPFDQLTEAVLDARQGEFERLKEFGIKAKQHGDKISMSFKGQVTEIDKGTAAMDAYLLKISSAAGVTGSMAAISKTTGGQISNLEDNVDLLYKTIGDRLKPQIDSTIGSLSSMVSTVKSWIEIPIERKLNDEIFKIKGLQVELTSSNTSEARRKEILLELEQLQPKITDGINKEAINFQKLADNIDLVTAALTKKITLSQIGERYAKVLTAAETASSIKAAARSAIDQAIYAADPELAKRTDLSFGEKQMAARNYLVDRGAKSNMGGQRALDRYGDNPFAYDVKLRTGSEQEIKNSALDLLSTGIAAYNKQQGIETVLAPELAKMKDEQNTLTKSIDGALGGKENPPLGGKTNGSNTTSSSNTSGGSISGGGKVTTMNIQIGSLISGGFTVQSTTVRESMPKLKDAVIETLLTAVNDANLAVN